MLVKRGPNAFNNFICALQKTKQLEVLRVLELTRSNLNQPPSFFIPPREISSHIPIRSNGKSSNGDYRSPPMQYSASPPSNSEYRRKVLQPPNYMPNFNIEVVPSSPVLRAPPVTDAAPPDYDLLDIRVTIGDEIKGIGQDVYSNRNIFPRGLALIINYEKFNNDIVSRRIGSEKDVIHLDQLLQQLGYRVIIKSDLTRKVSEVISKLLNTIKFLSMQF